MIHIIVNCYLLLFWLGLRLKINMIFDEVYLFELLFLRKSNFFGDFLGMFTPRMPNWKRGRIAVRNTIYGLSNSV